MEEYHPSIITSILKDDRDLLLEICRRMLIAGAVEIVRLRPRGNYGSVKTLLHQATVFKLIQQNRQLRRIVSALTDQAI